MRHIFLLLPTSSIILLSDEYYEQYTVEQLIYF